MQVIVDNLVTAYGQEGSGKLLLMLHGWGDNHNTFKLLGGLLDAYTKLALDLPGFGSSQAPPKAWNLDDYAEFLAHFLTKLGVEEDIYAVIGHSNGGALAIRALSLGKLKADKLILLASAGVRNNQPLKRMATRTVAKVGKSATFWLPKTTRQNLRQKLYGTIGSDMLVVPELAETFKLTVAQDVQTDAAKLQLPTLIINADRDPAIPLRDGERFHYLIKHSKLEILPGSSHFIHHEYAEPVSRQINQFLHP
jgi:pimeloyl-ACP methyl ester carboxylesterase